MHADHVKALIQKHLDAEARHDSQSAASYYSADSQYFLAPLGLLFKGRDAVAAQYGNSYVSFPDLETTVDGDAAGPSSYTHWGRLRGTMNGQFMGLPPTGKKMDTRLVALYDIVDDQIVRETVHFDLEEFCSQLGLDVQTVRDRAKATSAAMAD